jgi:hypothetical protein
MQKMGEPLSMFVYVMNIFLLTKNMENFKFLISSGSVEEICRFVSDKE